MDKIGEIRAWLKRERISREEFAARIGVVKSTVDNWLCGNHPIPRGRLQLIEQAMLAPPATAAVAAEPVNVLDEVQAITIVLTRAEYARVRAAVERHNAAHPASPLTIEQWARQTILAAALATAKTPPPGKHPPAYGEAQEPFA